MDPEQEVRIQSVVWQASDRIDAVHVLMDQVDPAGGLLCLLSGPEREGEGELERAFPSFPWIAFVETGLASSSQDQRMGRLHQEGPGSSEEDCGLPVHLPRGRVRPEKPHSIRIARPPHLSTVAGGYAGQPGKSGYRRRKTWPRCPSSACIASAKESLPSSSSSGCRGYFSSAARWGLPWRAPGRSGAKIDSSGSCRTRARRASTRRTRSITRRLSARPSTQTRPPSSRSPWRRSSRPCGRDERATEMMR